jgi:putative sterol carrier protein
MSEQTQSPEIPAYDIQKMFNHSIPDGMAKKPEVAKEIGGKFQINITGENGGGEWYVDTTANSCVPGNPGGAECTVTISVDDFRKYLSNPQAHGMQLFFAGKLKIAGNQMLAMKLGKLYDLREA